MRLSRVLGREEEGPREERVVKLGLGWVGREKKIAYLMKKLSGGRAWRGGTCKVCKASKKV